ncbi:MAG: sulfotransferase, partial [Acidobacteriota bacterium]
MSGGEIERRIFVVGVPRSGTTLLQSLLAAHSQLTSFTESHFFSRYFRAVPGLSTAILTRDPTPRLIEFLRENPADDSEQPAPRLATGRLLPLASRRVGRQLLAVLDQLALSRGFAGWIEKTPRHLR